MFNKFCTGNGLNNVVLEALTLQVGPVDICEGWDQVYAFRFLIYKDLVNLHPYQSPLTILYIHK